MRKFESPEGAMSVTPAARRHRVAIVGCGFGGLFAARALRRAEVDVTVIDRSNHHLFQPLLYQMATGILAEGDIAPPIRDILRHQRNTTVVLGDVQGIDLDARRLTIETLGQRSEVSYDSLILATGASQSYFGHPEFARDAPGMKTIDDALELRGRIFGAFEMAERESDPAAAAALADFRGGWRGTNRCRVSRADRRIGATVAAPQLPPHRPRHCAGRAP